MARKRGIPLWDTHIKKKDLDRQIMKGTIEQGKMLMTINATHYFLKSKQIFQS